MTIRVLLVPAGIAPPAVMEIEPTAEVIHDLVGGWLRVIHPGVFDPDGPRWRAYCDDEGARKERIVNVWASELAYRLGWPPIDFLVGPVLFLGDAGERETDIPQEVVDLFFTMIVTGNW